MLNKLGLAICFAALVYMAWYVDRSIKAGEWVPLYEQESSFD